MPLPTITIVGNLTSDPELRWTQSGKAVVNFRIACNDRKKDEAGNWVDGDTTFLDVTSWRAPSAIADTCKKGSKVVVFGTLKQRTYETKDGNSKTVYEVVAEEVATLLYDKTGQVTGSQSITQVDPWVGTTTDETPF